MHLSPPITILVMLAANRCRGVVRTAPERANTSNGAVIHHHPPRARALGERAHRRGRTSAHGSAGRRGVCEQTGEE